MTKNEQLQGLISNGTLEKQVGPITRTDLALFAGASGDHNPLHIDIDVARSAGLDDVFCHGMLSMAYLGHLLTSTFKQENLRQFKVRFSAITQVNDTVMCRLSLRDTFEQDGQRLVAVDVQVCRENGEVTLQGDAIAALE